MSFSLRSGERRLSPLPATKAELKALETLRDEEAMKELMAAMAKKGISVSEVIALIRAIEGEA